MKKLLLSVLLVVCQVLSAQDAFYLAFQPADLGVGVRCDWHIGRLGLYNSFTYGDWGVYREYGLKHHMKMTAGVLLPLSDYRSWEYAVSAGFNYHSFRYSYIEGFEVDSRILDPCSFELGLTVRMRWWALGVRTDILRWEPCIDLKIPLRGHNR